MILTAVNIFESRLIIEAAELKFEESAELKVNPSVLDNSLSTIKFESVSTKNSIEKLFAAEEPLFLTLALITTLSPLTGNRGVKEISATERSNCFGVKLLILPGVLNSISVDEPQFPKRFRRNINFIGNICSCRNCKYISHTPIF